MRLPRPLRRGAPLLLGLLLLGATDCPLPRGPGTLSHFLYLDPLISTIAVGEGEIISFHALSDSGDVLGFVSRIHYAAGAGLDAGPVLGVETEPSGAFGRDHLFHLPVRGVSPGTWTIDITTDDLDPARNMLTAHVTVYDVPTVTLTPATIVLRPGEEFQTSCIASLRSGAQAEPLNYSYRSLHEGIASIGFFSGYIRAEAVGVTDVICTYRETYAEDADTARVIVTTAPPAPPPSRLAGGYVVSGTAVERTCPLTTFGSPFVSEAVATASESGGVTTLRMFSRTEMTGTYNPVTGAWFGSGETTRSFEGRPVIVTEWMNGTFADGPPLRLTGTLTYQLFETGTRAFICATQYDATFTRSGSSLRAGGTP